MMNAHLDDETRYMNGKGIESLHGPQRSDRAAFFETTFEAGAHFSGWMNLI